MSKTSKLSHVNNVINALKKPENVTNSPNISPNAFSHHEDKKLVLMKGGGNRFSKEMMTCNDHMTFKLFSHGERRNVLVDASNMYLSVLPQCETTKAHWADAKTL